MTEFDHNSGEISKAEVARQQLGAFIEDTINSTHVEWQIVEPKKENAPIVGTEGTANVIDFKQANLGNGVALSIISLDETEGHSGDPHMVARLEYHDDAGEVLFAADGFYVDDPKNASWEGSREDGDFYLFRGEVTEQVAAVQWFDVYDTPYYDHFARVASEVAQLAGKPGDLDTIEAQFRQRVGAINQEEYPQSFLKHVAENKNPISRPIEVTSTAVDELFAQLSIVARGRAMIDGHLGQEIDEAMRTTLPASGFARGIMSHSSDQDVQYYVNPNLIPEASDVFEQYHGSRIMLNRAPVFFYRAEVEGHNIVGAVMPDSATIEQRSLTMDDIVDAPVDTAVHLAGFEKGTMHGWAHERDVLFGLATAKNLGDAVRILEQTAGKYGRGENEPMTALECAKLVREQETIIRNTSDRLRHAQPEKGLVSSQTFYMYQLPSASGRSIDLRSSNNFVHYFGSVGPDGFADTSGYTSSGADIKLKIDDSEDTIDIKVKNGKLILNNATPLEAAKAVYDVVMGITDDTDRFPELGAEVKSGIEANDPQFFDVLREGNITPENASLAIAVLRYYLGKSQIKPVRYLTHSMTAHDFTLVRKDIPLHDGQGRSLLQEELIAFKYGKRTTGYAYRNNQGRIELYRDYEIPGFDDESQHFTRTLVATNPEKYIDVAKTGNRNLYPVTDFKEMAVFLKKLKQLQASEQLGRRAAPVIFRRLGE
jgi:hypothetical protein